MSEKYIPLYRKYRPQSFADLIGQEHITKTLSNAIKLDKIAHAYLFCGPRGTGKTSSARIFAKSLNCVNGPTITPCNTCVSCVDITNSTPVDVIEIDAASNRSVEDAQNILEKIQYVPLHGKFKIYIIDEVHMLSNTAFNALLKTLEEPPSNVIFILATTEPHKVLETIISRCQRFDFRRITVDDIFKRLEFVANNEAIKISKDALFAIAKNAQGGMRDALALLEQLSILDTDKEVDISDVENLLGKISIENLYNLVDKIFNRATQEAVQIVNTIYNKGSEPSQILINLIEYFRNMLVVKNCQDKKIVLELTQLTDDWSSKLKIQSENIDNNTINYILDRLANYLREIKNSTNRYLTLEIAIIELSVKASNTGYSDLIKRIEELENIVENGEFSVPVKSSNMSIPVLDKNISKPVIKESTTTKTIAENREKPKEEKIEKYIKIEENNNEKSEKITEVSVSTATVSISELWGKILNNIESLPTRSFFTNLSKPLEISEKQIEIGFLKDIFVKQAKENPKMQNLEKAISKIFDPMPIIKMTLLTENELTNKPIQEPVKVAEIPAVEKQTSQDVEIEEDEEIPVNSPVLSPNNTEENRQEITKLQHSDNAKMVADLFNGKYID